MNLREMEPSDELEALKAHHELASEDFEFLLSYNESMSWQDFLSLHQNLKVGRNMPDGYVPATFFLAEADGHIVGRCSVRHELNDFLRAVGGHIGYAVRPEFRRRGYAKQILAAALIYCRELGLEQVLVTCDDSNVASSRTIESQGGTLESTIIHEATLKRRYWIDLH